MILLGVAGFGGSGARPRPRSPESHGPTACGTRGGLWSEANSDCGCD